MNLHNRADFYSHARTCSFLRLNSFSLYRAGARHASCKSAGCGALMDDGHRLILMMLLVGMTISALVRWIVGHSRSFRSGSSLLMSVTFSNSWITQSSLFIAKKDDISCPYTQAINNKK